MAAAVEAAKAELDFEILEASQPFNTIANFPKRKPIFTYPTGMTPEGELQVSAEVKEELLDELKEQIEKAGIRPREARATHIERSGGSLLVHLGDGDPIKTRRVIVAIGRSGNFRRLGVPGEELDKVNNRLHDPKDFAGKRVLVVGGGDSAMEAAIALTQCGAEVTLSYRKTEFARAKPENIEKVQRLAANPEAEGIGVDEPSSERVTTASGEWVRDRSPDINSGTLSLLLPSNVKEIQEGKVILTKGKDEEVILENDAVFPMIGREPPLDFFRRSGIDILGEGIPKGWVLFGVFLFFCVFLYTWKGGAPSETWLDPWPGNMPRVFSSLGDWWQSQVADRSTLLGTLAVSMTSRSFYYTFLYAAAVVIFGVIRIKRRKTPYVTLQTCVLMAIQTFPLFILPEIVFPLMGYNGWFDSGFGRTIADGLFPLSIPADQYLAGNWPDWGHPREYWRAYGLILAWPLMVYNIFTEQPLMWWIVIGALQTFGMIPLLIYFFGKGAYCGWICSCGALAETLGDAQRHKMPHGPFWNKLNMAGQVILWVAIVLLILRILGWMMPGSAFDMLFDLLLSGKTPTGETVNPLNYKWLVDVFLAGIIGVGFYFKYSGRVWCRFFCPLAALMHVYTRFSRFGIIADKKKCISCNVCTSVCHQGIDIMNFANKGAPMQDPECVRCSACVQSCPTGVLEFGQVDKNGSILSRDSIPASPVLMAERGKGK